MERTLVGWMVVCFVGEGRCGVVSLYLGNKADFESFVLPKRLQIFFSS